MTFFDDKNNSVESLKDKVDTNISPKSVVEPEIKVSIDTKPIDNIISHGGSVNISGKSGKEFNELYAHFTKERKAGELRMSYCNETSTITATSLKHEKEDTKL